MASTISIDGTPTNGSNPWLDSLIWGGAWSSGSVAKVTITFTFKSGVDPEPGGAIGKLWTAAEKAAMRAAMKTWEAVANVDFVEAKSGADMWFWLFDNTSMSGIAGFAEVPDPQENATEPLYLLMNTDDAAWRTPGSLSLGGWSYATMIHELGHSLGLAHPHDGGLRTNANLFPGVTAANGDFGDYNLNQGIYTIMSYNDGWKSKFPNHADFFRGSAVTPMALDIAAVQSIYGPNTSYKKGNDTYALPTANAAGTGWICIWDAGGADTISASNASRSVTINLNPATGSGPAAGGYVSFATSIMGGFTIAKGVVIEKAKGGKASDKITGNAAENTLSGAGGNDKIYARSGDDKLYGGSGNDHLDGGAGTDTVSYSAATKGLNASLLRKSLLKHSEQGSDTYTGIENLIGGIANDRLEGNTASNVLNGGKGADRLIGGSGNDTYVLDNSSDWVSESSNEGIDKIQSSVSVSFDFGDRGTLAYIGANVETIELSGSASRTAKGNSRDNVVKGNAGNNNLYGNGGNDSLSGGIGNDRLEGGAGADRMSGGSGFDEFVFSADLNSIDTITEFFVTDDTLYLDQGIFTQLQKGTLNAATLVQGTSALDTDDRIIFDPETGAMYYDTDGIGLEAATQFLRIETLNGSLTAADLIVI